MAEQQSRSTIQLAQELLNHLPKEIDDKLKVLLLRAEDEKNPTLELEITDFLSSHDNIRRWLKEQINLRSGTRDGYSQLAGKSKPAPASQKWICPNSTCDQWMLVIQEGEDPPVCKKHKRKMIRQRKKKG